jgi:hypothetical protein
MTSSGQREASTRQGSRGGPEIACQCHHGVLGGVTLDMVDQGQSGRARFRREGDCDRVA